MRERAEREKRERRGGRSGRENELEKETKKQQRKGGDHPPLLEPVARTEFDKCTWGQPWAHSQTVLRISR